MCGQQIFPPWHIFWARGWVPGVTLLITFIVNNMGPCSLTAVTRKMLTGLKQCVYWTLVQYIGSDVTE
jgi:hypothetical protein